MRTPWRSIGPLSLALIAGLSRVGAAQVSPPPPPTPLVRQAPAAAAAPAVNVKEDLNRLSHELAGSVRRLSDDVASDLGRSQDGRHLHQDVKEMAEAVDEFHESLHEDRGVYRRRRSYSELHESWRHLRREIDKRGALTPAVAADVRRVEELDDRIQRTLGLRSYPGATTTVVTATAPVQAAPAPNPAFGATQRLAYSLVQRAEFLAASIQAEAADIPAGDRRLRHADQLSQACGAFYDALAPVSTSAEIGAAFGPVAVQADRLGRDLQSIRRPPTVDQAWQSFASADALLRARLNLPPPAIAATVVVRPPQGPSPLVALSEQLVQEVDAFVQVFSQSGGTVPQGAFILGDAQRLEAAAVAFRRRVGQGANIDVVALGEEFQTLDVYCQRLARRVNRIARGRTGPNIQQVQKIAAICEQMRSMLGVPGYGGTVVQVTTP